MVKIINDELQVAERIEMHIDSTIDIKNSVAAKIVSFSGIANDAEHVALIYPSQSAIPVVRVHSECLTGDVFGSQLCDCGPQLLESKKRLEVDGGILLYLRQEGRGIGLYNKLIAYRLQHEGLDTYEANRAQGLPEDSRDFGIAAKMLLALGVTECRLITNNPDKEKSLIDGGINVRECISTAAHQTLYNHKYLKTKQQKGHSLSIEEKR